MSLKAQFTHSHPLFRLLLTSSGRPRSRRRGSLSTGPGLSERRRPEDC